MLTGWSNRLLLTIPQQSEELTDFPLAVYLSASCGSNAFDASAVFSELGSSSLKIAVEFENSGLQCPVEVSVWDGTAGHAVLFVKVPSVSASVATHIYLYFDSTHADNTSYVGATGSAAAQSVWDSNFRAVYHFTEDPASQYPQDSTGNGNHSTSFAGSPDLVSGFKNGGGWSLSGTGEYASVPHSTSLNITGGITLESCVYHTGEDYSGIITKAALSGSYDIYNLFLRTSAGSACRGYIFTGGQAVGGNPAYNTWKCYAMTYDQANIRVYGDGSQIGLTAYTSALGTNTQPLRLGAIYNTSNSFAAVLREIRVSSGARSAAWVSLSAGSLLDNAVTFAVAPMTIARRLVIEHVFSLPEIVRLSIARAFSLPERLTLHHVFGDAPRLRKTLYHVFGDMLARRKTIHHKFGDYILLRKTYERVFSMPDLVRKVLYHDFAITSAALRKVTYHDWSIEDVDHLRKTIHQVFGLLGDSGELLTYTVSTQLDGETVDNPAGINIEGDIDLYYIDCTLTIGGQQQWARYRRGQRLDLSINGTTYTLLVTRPQRTRQQGSSSYTVVAQSPVVTLGKGWAEPVEGELVGFASQIAASLAPGFAIDWQIHDEYYGPGEFIAAGEYPIELIVRLAAAMKGAVQSNRDGSLKVIRRRIRRDKMADMTPDYTLADAEDWFTVSETPEYMEGYNRFAIGSQNQAAVGLRLEQEPVSKSEKLVRGYQTPWTGNFDLAHTGGTWVYIVPEGIEERQIEEVVEFVDGVGSTQYPIYSWSAIEWQQNNLGTVTFSEDGSLESTVAGDSLLAITYRTRCRKWRVRDPRNEQLQLVSEEA